MKYRLFSVLLIMFGLFNSAISQNCSKQTFCGPEQYGDFDYKSQTRSAVLAPGDTVRTTVVVYSDQITRILLCGDPQLGALSFKLFEPVKNIKRTIKQINKTSDYVSEEQKDERGNVVRDDWGDPLIVEREVVKYDTLWGRTMEIKEVEIFDSKKGGKGYWQEEVDKSKRLIIEAIVADGDRTIEGCVNVQVGFKLKKRKQFVME